MVVVSELFSLVTSAICVRIRGHRSEVTKTVYHMAQAFRLMLRSYHSGLVGTVSALFCYVNIKLYTFLCRLASYACMRFGLLLLLLLLF